MRICFKSRSSLRIAANGGRNRIGIGHIGFDVEDGGAIDHVDAPHSQPQILALLHHTGVLHHGQANGVGPER